MSVFVLVNLTKNCEKAREDVLQENTELECSNVLNVIDWLLNPSLKPLFGDFIDVLINVSTDSKLRSLLTEHATRKIFDTFSMGLLQGDIKFISKVFGLLRNLSFEPKNEQILKAIESEVFIQQNLSLLQNNSIARDDKKVIAGCFIDMYVSLLTSENFMDGKDVEVDKVFTNMLRTTATLARNLCSTEDSELIDRAEVLEHIIQQNEASTGNIDTVN